MTNRQEFLQIGSAATLATFVPALSTVPRQGSGIAVRKIIYDRRYRDSATFARHLAALLDSDDRSVEAPHELLQPISGDIPSLWYDELDALWRREPVAIAGMTAHGPLFSLERLAWDKGLRVVWRCEHRQHGEGIITHTMHGPRNMLADSRDGANSLARLDCHWSESIARLMLGCQSGTAELDLQTLTTPVHAPAQQDVEVNALLDPLISWIIAPARHL